MAAVVLLWGGLSCYSTNRSLADIWLSWLSTFKSIDHIFDPTPIMAQNTTPKVGGFELAHFYDDPARDSLSITQWIQLITRAMALANWTDETAAKAAQMALRGPAAVWSSNLIEAEATGIDKWSTFMPLVEARFKKPTTLAQKAQLQAGLVQKPNEPVMTFWDRVNAASYLLVDDFPAMTQGADAAQYKKSKQDARELTFRQHFVAGLAPAVREQLISRDPTTLDELQKEATRLETAQADRLKEKRDLPTQVYAIEAAADPTTEATDHSTPAFDFGQLREELTSTVTNAIKTGFSAATRGRPRGGQASRPNFGRTGRSAAPRGPTPFNCYYCNKPSHYARDCRAKKRDIANGVVRRTQNNAVNVAYATAFEELNPSQA